MITGVLFENLDFASGDLPPSATFIRSIHPTSLAPPRPPIMVCYSLLLPRALSVLCFQCQLHSEGCMCSLCCERCFYLHAEQLGSDFFGELF
jgi:hypothetical protein